MRTACWELDEHLMKNDEGVYIKAIEKIESLDLHKRESVNPPNK